MRALFFIFGMIFGFGIILWLLKEYNDLRKKIEENPIKKK